MTKLLIQLNSVVNRQPAPPIVIWADFKFATKNYPLFFTSPDNFRPKKNLQQGHSSPVASFIDFLQQHAIVSSYSNLRSFLTHHRSHWQGAIVINFIFLTMFNVVRILLNSPWPCENPPPTGICYPAGNINLRATRHHISLKSRFVGLHDTPSTPHIETWQPFRLLESSSHTKKAAPCLCPTKKSTRMTVPRQAQSFLVEICSPAGIFCSALPDTPAIY